MSIQLSITGLDGLEDATGELADWGKAPFKGKASLRIKNLWAKENLKTFKSKGKSIGERWPPLNPVYKSWKSKNYPSKPLLVLKGSLRDSVTNVNSKLMVFNNQFGRQLILGTRVPYASAHNYGTRKLPKRQFIKITQNTANDWANELRKDVELAQKGSKRWRGR